MEVNRMNEAVSLSPALRRENEYYAQFWSSDAWGTAQPNNDERLRAAAITKLIEEFVIPRSNAASLRILDLGCGRGWLSSLLANYGSVLGIDPVPAAIERAKVLFPTLTVRVADSSNLISEGFAGQFDLIVSSEVIEHVVRAKKPEFLSNIKRLLKPNAFAILTTPRGELWQQWQRLGNGEQPVEDWITEPDLKKLCESTDLRIVKKDRVFLPDCPFDWLSRLAARNTRLMAASGLKRRLRHHRGIYQIVALHKYKA
jgi:2-polyprenyl-3-methyl-5-hydroxy-6-metoxy-1,4-benzoquinol methylase